MAYIRVHGYDNGRIMAAAQPGDTVSLGETATVLNNAANATITAGSLAGQVILRQGAAGPVTDTTDTAVQIMQAMYGNTGSDPRVSEGFLVFYSNQTAQVVTVVGGTGVTISGNTTIAANSMKTIFIVCTAQGTKTFLNGIFTNVGATFNCICL